jgi:hypothetical protein
LEVERIVEAKWIASVCGEGPVNGGVGLIEWAGKSGKVSVVASGILSGKRVAHGSWALQQNEPKVTDGLGSH